jgi:hypothetical protein
LAIRAFDLIYDPYEMGCGADVSLGVVAISDSHKQLCALDATH